VDTFCFGKKKSSSNYFQLLLDSVIVAGASSKDSGVWDEGENPAEPCWDDLRKRWHVTLIDFGFARALTPGDVAKPSLSLKRDNLDASYHATNLSKFGASRRDLDRSGHSLDRSNSSFGGENLDRSISRRLVKRMSALGNRAFAAPEITDSVEKETISAVKSKTSGDEVDVTATLSEFVTEYGLLVDAYSLGCTIRFMMTGVLPHHSVEDAIAAQQTVSARFSGWVGKKLSSKSKPAKRKVKFRREEDLPGEVQRLIKCMTEKAVKKRTSVRTARKYPWILDVLGEGAGEVPNELSYLKLALKGVPGSADPAE
jgi:serine/threonine protein kinase